MSKQNGNKGRRFDRAFKEVFPLPVFYQTSGQAGSGRSQEILRHQRQPRSREPPGSQNCVRRICFQQGPHEDAAKEITRLRRERDLARQERDLPKKSAMAFFARRKSMRFSCSSTRTRAGLAMADIPPVQTE